MRTLLSIKNSLFSIAGQLLLILLNFFVRKFFINYFSIEYLGMEGLFADIFNFLNLAELGIGSAIIYNLYKPLALKNHEQISDLMLTYKKIYRILGILIFFIGIAFIPFIPYLVVDLPAVDQSFIVLVYVLQLSSTVATYFFAHKRSLFLADQSEFVTIRIDMIINILFCLLKIVSIALFKNYILYLILNICRVIISNLWVSISCNHKYFYLQKTSSKSISLYNDKELLKDLKHVSLHKLSAFVFSSTDNLIISIFISLTSVGIISNYFMILAACSFFVNAATNSLQASLGNFVNEGADPLHTEDVLRKHSFMCHVISSVTIIGAYAAAQHFITLFFGAEYLLPESALLILCINAYINLLHKPIYNLYTVLGYFRRDILGAILPPIFNLVTSIILVQSFGIPGTLAGTMLSIMIYWIFRTYYSYKYYFQYTAKRYILSYLGYTAVFLMILFGVKHIAEALFAPVTILNFVGRASLAILIPILINVAFYCKTKEYEFMIVLAKKIITLCFRKGSAEL